MEPQLLGMLLFIISEIMVFGAFFTAYFFIRVVSGDDWFPFRGHELPVAVAGVAWAPDRGISRVEVRVDEGEWQNATIATPIGPQTWVQWKWAWQAEPGEHVIAVRATDGAGEVQTDQVSPPDPDGARGHHTIRVRVA